MNAAFGKFNITRAHSCCFKFSSLPVPHLSSSLPPQTHVGLSDILNFLCESIALWRTGEPLEVLEGTVGLFLMFTLFCFVFHQVVCSISEPDTQKLLLLPLCLIALDHVKQTISCFVLFFSFKEIYTGLL